MENEAQQLVPVRNDFVVRELADEVVLYDRKTRRAHCLNPAASAVWRLCDGHRNIAEIARILERDEDLVCTVLQQLNESRLLRNEGSAMNGKDMLSRRELVKKIGIGASVVLPMVTSILVPSASAARSPLSQPRPRRSRRSG